MARADCVFQSVQFVGLGGRLVRGYLSFGRRKEAMAVIWIATADSSRSFAAGLMPPVPVFCRSATLCQTAS